MGKSSRRNVWDQGLCLCRSELAYSLALSRACCRHSTRTRSHCAPRASAAEPNVACRPPNASDLTSAASQFRRPE
jgi:hypothetical protein